MKVGLSYCVFFDSIMIDGLRTSFVLEGEKCTLYIIPQVSCLKAKTDLFVLFSIWE